ncbi:MAG: ATP-binding protein [Actinoplanes sp.]
MKFRHSVARTAGFAVLYVLAGYAGRLTIMDGGNLSLVWPAAGVSAIWFLAQYQSRWRALDVLSLAVVTMIVNMVTGASASVAAFFVVANLVQAGVFVLLFRRWLPHLWGGGGRESLARVQELWPLTTAALISTACGALVGTSGVWIVNGGYSWDSTAVWLTRNTVSILLIGVTSLRVAHLLREFFATHPGHALPALTRLLSSTPASRKAEYTAVVVLSAAAYGLVFGLNHDLPLAFAVLTMTFWAGLRLHTGFVVLHDLAFGSLAVILTISGHGVFAHIASDTARAMVAQLFVGMVAVLGLALALGRDERVALIRQLRASQRAAADQARLMTTIVDSMAEGLTVVDHAGRFLIRNPAVHHLLGGVVSQSGSAAEPSLYGFFHPDGTPLTTDEMPHRRALAGHDVAGMDILVRNPALPDGRIMNASSTALPGDLDGTRYAVTVFHDVTAERRHRDDLAAFAGVVAHDLLNPLTTVEGWSENLTESFQRHPAHPVTADALGSVLRIRRAATRMRHLINNLLEYTTARDAVLAATDLSLGDVVNDIASARIDQAQSDGSPVPRFDLHELHPVHADPVMIRQLLENLISNAIKYTTPGATPSIAVTTRIVDRQVAVQVTDTGIGIPAGQHHHVFDNFHRAHRDALYPGTGLGLGICKRIVERHDGTITAEDNPDQPGSRFTFTLPAIGRRA